MDYFRPDQLAEHTINAHMHTNSKCNRIHLEAFNVNHDNNDIKSSNIQLAALSYRQHKNEINVPATCSIDRHF